MALSKNEIIQQLTNPGIIAVVRARSQAQVVPLAEALVAGGVIAVDVVGVAVVVVVVMVVVVVIVVVVVETSSQ